MAKREKKTAMFNFKLEEQLLEKGHRLAEQRGMSLAALLRGLLIKELESENQKL